MTAFRKFKTTIFFAVLLPLTALAQGWPSQYGGVMLQGFFWNSYYPYALDGSRRSDDMTWCVMNWSDANGTQKWSFPSTAYSNDLQWEVPTTTWRSLNNHRKEIAPYIDVMWVPQSGANTAPQTYVAYPGQLNPDCMGFVPVYWFNHGKTDENGNYHTASWRVPVQDSSTKDTWWQDGGNDIWESAEVKSYFGTENELREMIHNYQNEDNGGTKVIMDVILNHKGGLDYWANAWFAFAENDSQKSEWYMNSYKSMSYNFPWETSPNPDPTYTQNGYDITWSSKDICGDDELFKGPIKDWFSTADKGGNDTADKGGWARDLDHTSEHVQYNINRYLDFLLNDLGYDGLRIDYVKGFSGTYMGKFLNEAGTAFAVGECYDGNRVTVGDWVRSTKTAGAIQSAAFDFPLKFQINGAFSKRYKDGHIWHKWSYLNSDGMIHDWQLKRYAVTFVDNHDTFKNLPHDQHHQMPQNGDGSNGDKWTYMDHGGANSTSGNDRLNYMMEEANAYILCMPGTPCLFYPHFMHPEWGVTIRKMIRARRTAGITNTSGLFGFGECDDDGGGWRVVGDKYELVYQVGDRAGEAVPSGYKEIWNNFSKDYVSGAGGAEHHDSNKVRVLISSSVSDEEYNNITNHGDGTLAGQLADGIDAKKANATYGYAIVDKPGGYYTDDVTVNIRPNRDGVILVYTTDGTTPTANSRRITDETAITYTADVTLKVGVLTGNTVVPSTIETRHYYIGSASVSTLHVYLQPTTDHLALYAWDNNGTVQDWISASSSSIQLVTIGGRRWYDFPINRSSFNFCIRYDNSETTDGYGNITNIGGAQEWVEKDDSGNDVNKMVNSKGVGDYLGVTQDVFLHIDGQEYTDVSDSYLAMTNNPLVSIDKASGTYEVGTLTVNINSNNSKYPIVYTTDGSAPTASSTGATLSKVLSLGTGNHTIRAGILKDGEVINTVARRYTVTAATQTIPTTGVNIYVRNKDNANTAVKIHWWGTGSSTYPGETMTKATVNGETWYFKHFDGSSQSFLFNTNGDTDKSGNISVTAAGDYFYDYYPTGYDDRYELSPAAYTSEDDNYIRIYINTSNDWYAYLTNNGLGSWPGTKIQNLDGPVTINSKSWYVKRLNKGTYTLILNNGSGGYGNQTEDISVSNDIFLTYGSDDGGTYSNVTTSNTGSLTSTPFFNVTSIEGVAGEVDALPSCATYVPGTHYIYFENDVDGVIAPYAYPFTDNATGGATEFAGSWPGEQLVEPVGTAPNGNTIYRYTIVDDVAPAMLIFNNLGGNSEANPAQTGNLVWVDGGYYTYSGGLSGSVTGSADANVATSMTLRDIILSGVVEQKYTVSNNVTCVKAQQVNGSWCLWVKDTDAEGVNRYEPTSDAMRENALANDLAHTNDYYGDNFRYDLLYKYDENHNLVNNFDQSNWMKIVLSGISISPDDYVGKVIEGGTITGTYTDIANPELTMNLLTPIVGKQAESYTYNKYTPANFIDHSGDDEYADYFFMRPRIQEYCTIWYAYWDGYKFTTPDVGNDIPGALEIADNLSGVSLVTGKVYKLEGFIENKKDTRPGASAPRRIGSPAGSTAGDGYRITITVADGETIPTAIDDIVGERTAVGVRYYNLQGVQSQQPFDGINIVVTTWNDGTTSTTKILK